MRHVAKALPGTACAAPPIVGLGASAGGLEPLVQFLARVPAASGLAFVVVQHMDPTHKALLAELLQRATAMPVREVRGPTLVQAGHVYVIPPAAEITLTGATLHLAKPSRPRGHRLPIDVMFGSLARELGERAIGVVLSGMGADGSAGLQAIHCRGGLTLAQLPASAQFDAMPRHAIATGCVDVIDRPAELPARILALLATPRRHSAATAMPGSNDATALARILALLHVHTRRDLSLYKSNTLQRRVARRVAVHRLGSMTEYADYVEGQPQELDLLLKELLIGVTAFFRDPGVWQTLKDSVLPALLARDADAAGPVRAWVAGCSTGEEAYSLAIAFTELQETLPQAQRRALQIFATDLDADAIAAARTGRYAQTGVQGLSPERLARFFARRPAGWQVDPQLRGTVLFAQHDLTQDPPLTRLDILLCRNLLIYFGAALQRRLMPLFHYSLRPGGVLLLGSAETVGRAQSLFMPLFPKSRIYGRSENAGPAHPAVFPTQGRAGVSAAPLENALPLATSPPANLPALADQLLLQSHAPPAVLVNMAGDILYISGRTGRYLEPAAGKANWNVHAMARPGIRAQLAVALRTALQTPTTVELRALRLDDGTAAALDITVQGIVQPVPLQGLALIVFRERPAQARRQPGDAAADVAAAPGSDELLRACEEIQALRQEMSSSRQELHSTNEALRATNEELQSANEELTSSQDEAQSMNEELQTINGELQCKLDDLALAQSDMQNLLNSTEIATLFLDEQFKVRRYTEQTARVIHLREPDIGRPLSELASTLLYPDLDADMRQTLRTLTISEKQIATTDGRWFSVRVMPYRTLADVVQGVVLTFVDITAAKELEARLREA
jgi:two-component system CheB/CheR fusion protein